MLPALLLFACVAPVFGQSVLIEAESFDQRGGWKLDTQFIREMGSPYMLAHGLGTPVADATAKITFPETGEYKVFVRTKDWVARWNAPGTPGRFQLLVNDQPLSETFGTQGAEWAWQAGGTVKIDAKEVELKLHDLTGFDGRCDAIFFTKEDASPPNESAILPAWRSRLLGLKEKPTEKSGYDLVVVGGGYAGMGAALSAARMGCKVALIQDRPVLGGNGSSEVRVWAMGNIRRGKFPRVGEIIEEFADQAKKSPGTYEEFGDEKKEAVVRAEPNIDLFLNHHAYQVDMDGEKKIAGVYAFDTRTSEQKRFTGKLYVDCTGHGTIGFLAGADFDMAEKGRMGMSNMWAWDEADKPREFPATPWALDLTMKDFPYPRDHHGQWFWESGFDKDALGDAEGIRDWNLRAVYGAFNAMKNKDGADKHEPAFLTWVAYVGGPRESRLLRGDVVLNQNDIISKREFSDGCVPSTWSIDLHYPKKQFAEKFPDNPFISIAVHDQRVDRNFGYPVPYRCFYSRNIDNLFMAGRCISVDHEALGTVRVMKTCGMMGEVVGKAASICATYDCTPREVYERYWPEMDTLLKLPGKAHRAELDDEIEIPDDIPALAGPNGPPTGLDPNKLAGTVVDDAEAERIGNWTVGTGLKGYVGYGYLYTSGNSGGAVRFAVEAPEAGVYDVRFAYQPHENRGKTVPVMVETKSDRLEVKINQQKDPPIEGGFISLGELQLDKGEVVTIVVATAGAGGTVHADAVQLVPAKK
ncbi:FAD-dependent oxidoreductase [Blastopirellula sp. J2-11]|uniref:FAD-dependent oxidoreductase n=1 Tax=Blastopirellula sp. J2-11 TaxID=2943192 RepID=UPI0021C8EBBE|nr:FAD-dependent oxidoreductase [Blastopirellula sp. J2-11]UUO09280.1 FAD-dependent oxidoreductase [Blastopirellula sp. J2-11]